MKYFIIFTQLDFLLVGRRTPREFRIKETRTTTLQTPKLDDRQVLGYVTVSPLPHNATGAESLDAGLRKPFKGDSMNVHEQTERALL